MSSSLRFMYGRFPRLALVPCLAALAAAQAGPVDLQAAYQEAYLKASNGEAEDAFGWAVALDGDTLVVAAPWESSRSVGGLADPDDNSQPDAGAAYVFVWSQTHWEQQAFVKAADTDDGDLFGTSVALSGDTLVVGVPFEDSGATGVNGDSAANDRLDSGAAYVFVRQGSTWVQEAYLKASNTGRHDRFGGSCAVQGDTIVIGAVQEDSPDNGKSDSGAVYVFERSGGAWAQTAYLKAGDADESDLFGNAVAIDGSTIVVGAFNAWPSADGSPRGGSAYVFVRANPWMQQARLDPANPSVYDAFGKSVAVRGDLVVVGADWEDSGGDGIDSTSTGNDVEDAGAAYAFERVGSDWSQVAYIKTLHSDHHDLFGRSVSISESGARVAIGCAAEWSSAQGVGGDQTNNDLSGAGAAFLFETDPWRQVAYVKASNTGAFDHFGQSIACTDHRMVVGAHLEDSASVGINGTQEDENAAFSGAAYAFSFPVGEAYCAASPNSTGSPATLIATGSPSDSLVLTSYSVPDTTGQLFYGPMMLAGSGSLGDGLRCVGGVTTRLLPLVSAGMMMQPSNTAIFAVDFSAPYASGLTGTKYFQHWFRSGLAAGAGSNASSAISITF